jgi:AcrR family transcriptional regulator
MTEQATTVAAGGRSRKLDQEREQAILRAAFDLLGETGYQGLRVDAVAARAQASKATLYRHWPTKAGLVVDAVQCCKVDSPPPRDTGSLRGDLVEWFGQIAEVVTGIEGPIMAGLFMAMHTDPDLAAELRAMRESKVPFAEAICARAASRGEIPAGYDAGLIDEIVPALFFMHFIAFGRTIDDAYVTHVVDDIIVPLLAREPRP